MLPAAASIKEQGANKGATTAFLISTPESGIDSIAVTYALLDPIMTVIRPLAAFCTAVTGGILENLVPSEKQAPPLARPSSPVTLLNVASSNTENRKIPLTTQLKTGIRYAFIEVWGDIVVWFLIGILIAGFITAMIPENMMESLLGGGVHAMLLMLIMGIPLYICATASTPVAAALILKGVSPGAALVFLLVGPATNITSLSVLIGILGRKSAIRYLITVSVMAVLFGLGVDYLYQLANISPRAIITSSEGLIPHWFHLICGLLLFLLSIKPIYKWICGKIPSKKVEKRHPAKTCKNEEEKE